MKGILSFRLLAFTNVPPDVKSSKPYEDSTCENSVWRCVYKIYDFISVKKLATFGYVVGILSHGNLSYFLDFILVSQRK